MTERGGGIVAQQGGGPGRERSAAGWAYGLVLIAHLAIVPVPWGLSNEGQIRGGVFLVAWLAALLICFISPGDKGPVSLSHYRFLRRTLLIGGAMFVVAAIAAALFGITFFANLHWSHAPGPTPEPPHHEGDMAAVGGLLGSLAFIFVALAAIGFVLVRALFGAIHLLQHHPVAMGRARLAQPAV